MCVCVCVCVWRERERWGNIFLKLCLAPRNTAEWFYTVVLDNNADIRCVTKFCTQQLPGVMNQIKMALVTFFGNESAAPHTRKSQP